MVHLKWTEGHKGQNVSIFNHLCPGENGSVSDGVLFEDRSVPDPCGEFKNRVRLVFTAVLR